MTNHATIALGVGTGITVAGLAIWGAHELAIRRAADRWAAGDPTGALVAANRSPEADPDVLDGPALAICFGLLLCMALSTT